MTNKKKTKKTKRKSSSNNQKQEQQKSSPHHGINNSTTSTSYLNVLIPCRSKSIELCSINKTSPKNTTGSKPQKAQNITFNTQNHYRLNLSDIPFVVGKSTAPSHRVGSNVQNVISMLKMHHPNLCGSMNHKNPRSSLLPPNNSSINNSSCLSNNNNKTCSKILKRNYSLKNASTNTAPSLDSNNFRIKTKTNQDENKVLRNSYSINLNRSNSQTKSQTPLVSCCSAFNNNDQQNNNNVAEVNDLLRLLQEEYTSLVLQHYDLTKKIVSSSNNCERKMFELQADHTHKKMKAKIKQINKLKAILNPSEHNQVNIFFFF
jgi:hypothetical protein